MRIVVLDGYCLNPGDLSWDSLRALGEVTVYDRTPGPEILARAEGATVILTNKTPLSAQTLSRLPDLRYIGVLATGYNVVDVAAATACGVVVSNVPTYGTHSVAQMTIALLLELCHHVGAHAASVKAGEWSSSLDWSYWKTPQVELAGKTFGVIGFGRIGRQAAAIAAAMGMRIVAFSPVMNNPLPGADFRWAEVDDLLRESDVVSLHCPLFPDTKGMIDAARLRTMKTTAFLLNTSRGPLVVEEDLAMALEEGWITGAAVDVLPQEPPVNGSPLFGVKNCIVTPHIAWATQEARTRLMHVAVGNLKAFLDNSPLNVVN